MSPFKRSSSPLWRSRPLILMVCFCVLAICTFGVIHKIYSRPLNPISALIIEPPASDLPAPPLNEESGIPAPEATLMGTLLSGGHHAVGIPLSRPRASSAATFTDDSSAPNSSASSADEGCVTILLVGVDGRAGGAISRTDTLMLALVCAEAKTASLLSIPRDLYVDIPGFGLDRINTALVHGAAAGDAAAGVALLMKTIQNSFQVPVDHYILVDFRAVIRSIDALGGVDIYVPYTIDDPTFPDMNYGYDPLFIPEGEHHFDGEMALKYARTRHQDNDFYRARRQQQLLFALHSQVLSLGLANFLPQIPTLYEQVRYGVFTDLSLEQILALAQLADDIPPENIVADVLDDDYVRSYTTDEGANVLLLLPTATKTLIAAMFAPRVQFQP